MVKTPLTVPSQGREILCNFLLKETQRCRSKLAGP